MGFPREIKSCRTKQWMFDAEISAETFKENSDFAIF